MVPVQLPALERYDRIKLDESERVLAMIPATINLILVDLKIAAAKRSQETRGLLLGDPARGAVRGDNQGENRIASLYFVPVVVSRGTHSTSTIQQTHLSTRRLRRSVNLVRAPADCNVRRHSAP